MVRIYAAIKIQIANKSFKKNHSAEASLPHIINRLFEMATDMIAAISGKINARKKFTLNGIFL